MLKSYFCPSVQVLLLAAAFFEAIERSGETTHCTQSAALAVEQTLRETLALRPDAAASASTSAAAAERDEATDKLVPAVQLVDAVASGNERKRRAHMRGATVCALLLLRLARLYTVC